jgi:hypothetical protein
MRTSSPSRTCVPEPDEDGFSIAFMTEVLTDVAGQSQERLQPGKPRAAFMVSVGPAVFFWSFRDKASSVGVRFGSKMALFATDAASIRTSGQQSNVTFCKENPTVRYAFPCE